MALCDRRRNSYSSCIAVCGRSILPPVMTPDKIREMQNYRKLAVEVEQVLEKKARGALNGSSAKGVSGAFHVVTDSSAKNDNVKEMTPHNLNGERKRNNESCSSKEGQEQNSDVSSMTSQLTESTTSIEPNNETVIARPAAEPAENAIRNVFSSTNLVDEMISQTASIRISQDEERSNGTAEKRKHETVPGLYFGRNFVDTAADMDEDEVFVKSFTQKMNGRKFFDDFDDARQAKTAWNLWLKSEGTEESFCSPGAIVFEGLGLVPHEEVLEGIEVMPEKRHSDISLGSNPPASDRADTTPPSLASTDLQKYMEASPETATAHEAESTLPDVDLNSVTACTDNDDAMSQLSTAGSSSIVTTKMNESALFFRASDDTNITVLGCKPLLGDCTKMPNHIRRASYTLECPSPALVAHAAYCKEQGCNVKDMSSFRRHSYPLISTHEDNVALKNRHSEQFVLNVVNDQSIREAKEKHLKRYLETVSRCPDKIEPSSPLDSARNEAGKGFAEVRGQSPEQATSESTIPSQDSKVLEEILREKQKQFIQLRKKLAEDHEEQMRRLLEQQTVEEDRLRKHFSKFCPSPSSDCAPSVMNETPKRFKKENAYFTAPKMNSARGSSDKGLQSPLTDDSKAASLVTASPLSTTLQQSASELSISNDALNSSLTSEFRRLPALVKGYLTRRLLKTEKVQSIVKTIRDTLEFAIAFHSETPIKGGCVTPAEARLHDRIVSQLTGACHDFHNVFFKLPTEEQMQIIAHDRCLHREKATSKENHPKRNLSSATIKSLERKKIKVQNTTNARSKSESRCKSAEAWLFSPKRRKIATEAITRANMKLSPRSRLASPKLQRMLSCTGLLPDKVPCNARKNLSAIYGCSESKPQSGSRTFRVVPKQRPVTNKLFSPKDPSKSPGVPWK